MVDVYTGDLEQAGTGIVPGENPSNALAVTYAEAQALVVAATLQAGLYYKITDYQTKVDAGSNVSFGSYGGTIYTGATEALIIRAISTTQFDTRAFSELYPDDDIEYDFNDNAVLGEGEGYIEDGVDAGDTITLSLIDLNTVRANKELSVNSRLEFETEDDTFYYYFDASDEGTGFELVDAGGGNTDINILQPIDYVGSGSWYLWIISDFSIASRTGYITRRKNREKNIETISDFRENTQLAFRPDLTNLTTYPVYNAATSYNKKDKVQYNGDIYLYMPHQSIVGQTPSVNSRYWALLIRDAADAYIYASETFGGQSHSLDPVGKLVPMIGQYDSSTQTFTKNLSAIENVLLESENAHVISEPRKYITHSDITVETDSDRIFITGNRVSNFHLISGGYDAYIGLGANVSDNFSKMKLNRACITGNMSGVTANYISNSTIVSCYYSTIGYNLTSSFINQLYYSNIGAGCNQIFIGYSWYFEIGASSNNIYMYYAYRVKIGSGSYRVYNYSGLFRNSTFGTETRRVTFTSTAHIENFNVLSRMGPTSGERIISCDIRETEAGNEFLTSGDLIVGNYVRFSTFGDKCYGFNVGGIIYYSNFGSNCRNFTVTSNINASSFGNSLNNITSASLQNCTFQNNINSITCASNMTGMSIGSKTSSITIAGEIASCSIEQSVSSINIQYTGVIRYLEIKQRIQGVTMLSTATWLNGFYNKELFMRSDGSKRVSWVDNTDTIIYIDPAV